MKTLLFIVTFLLASTASAMDWYLFTSTDTSHGSNTEMWELTSEAKIVPFATNKKLKFECGVTAEEVNTLGELLGRHSYPPFNERFGYREVVCKMGRKVFTSIPISCTYNGEDSEIRDLYIRYKDNTYSINVQCWSQEEDKP